MHLAARYARLDNSQLLLTSFRRRLAKTDSGRVDQARGATGRADLGGYHAVGSCPRSRELLPLMSLQFRRLRHVQSFYEQFKAGIRYVDLRACWNGK